MADGATVLYTRADCSYSGALKHDLDRAGISYEEVDLLENPEAIPVVEGLTGGERITPVLLEPDGQVTVGYYGLG